MSLPPTPELERFTQAQAATFERALAELKHGRKTTHWMWFIFPQLKGLGMSQMAQTYGLAGLDEARAYLAHTTLGPRLMACTRAMLAHAGEPAEAILGGVDALKFRSCMTLFARAAPDEPAFTEALRVFCDARPDPRTLQLLDAASAP